jgi:hypothetical protein
VSGERSESEGAIRLGLEIERCSDPIEGRFVDASGTAAGFQGWLQLAAALEAIRRGEPRKSETKGEGEGDEQ